MAASIPVLIAHPREVVRAGLVAVLSEAGMKLVGEAGDAAAATTLAKRHKPAVLIVDAAIPGANCFELLRKLAKPLPTMRTIVISAIDNPTYMARAHAAGAANFLSEGVTAAELTRAVEDAVAGKPAASKAGFGKISAAMGGRLNTAAVAAGLTPREQQVLVHISYGLPNEEIAGSLGISVETVKEHVQNLLRKLAVRDRTQAAVWAVKAGAT